MSIRYFDAHCHPQFSDYDADRKDVLARMEKEKIGGMVVGCDVDSSRKAVALAEQHSFLYAAAGLHPNHAADESFSEKIFTELAAHPKVHAIGECGLDYYRSRDAHDAAKKAQADLFEQHVHLAATKKLPLIIHTRPTKGSMDAYEDALSLLESAKREYGASLTGDFHFFAGDIVIARRAISLGFTLSFTAVITFARDYDDVIRYVPLNSILAETDSPYVAPASRRGQRNDSLAVRDVVKALAGVRGMPEDEMRAVSVENARRLFHIDV